MVLHNAIKRQMQIHGVTQADISRKSGLSTAVVSQICSGKTRDPGILKVMKIAKAIGCTMNDLVEDVDE